MVNSTKLRACAGCGERRPVSRFCLPEGEYRCHSCRRKRRAEREAYRAVERGSQDELQRRREAKPSKGSTTQRGLGHAHQQAVAELKRSHVDGSPCDWCGRPMWLDRTLNWDYQPGKPTSGILHGDHSVARACRLGSLADRLLHGACNRQRGDGANDHLAWINHQTPYESTQLERRNA